MPTALPARPSRGRGFSSPAPGLPPPGAPSPARTAPTAGSTAAGWPLAREAGIGSSGEVSPSQAWASTPLNNRALSRHAPHQTATPILKGAPTRFSPTSNITSAGNTRNLLAIRRTWGGAVVLYTRILPMSNTSANHAFQPIRLPRYNLAALKRLEEPTSAFFPHLPAQFIFP